MAGISEWPSAFREPFVFSDEEVKAQRGKGLCLRSHSKLKTEVTEGGRQFRPSRAHRSRESGCSLVEP